MARNKARRPGGPPRSDRASEGAPADQPQRQRKAGRRDIRRGCDEAEGLRPEGPRYPRGRTSMRQVPCAMPQLRRTPKPAPPARCHPDGRDWRISARRRRSTRERGRSRIPGRNTQSRTTGCASGAEDVAQLARRARGRHRRRRRRGACAQLLGAVSGQRAAGRASRPGSRRGADVGRTEGQNGDVARLTSRLDALERGSGAAVDEKIRGQVEALNAADAALQKRLDAFEPGTAGAQVQDLATRVDQLEAAVADAGSDGRDERGGDAVARRAGGQAQRPVDHRRTARAGHSRRSAGAGRTDLPHWRARGALRSGRGSRRQEVEGLAGRARRCDAADHRRPGAGRRPERQGRGAR